LPTQSPYLSFRVVEEEPVLLNPLAPHGAHAAIGNRKFVAQEVVMRPVLRDCAFRFSSFSQLHFFWVRKKNVSHFATTGDNVLTGKEVQSCPQPVVDNFVYNCSRFVVTREYSADLR